MERDCIRAGYEISGDAVWIRERRMIKERKAKMLGLDAPVRQEHTGPAGEPIKQDVRLVQDALADPDTRQALDDLSKRLESKSGRNGHEVV